MLFGFGTQFAIAFIVMTQPREIIQGTTYFITRRVLHRRFLLRPDATMTEFILYSLAVIANRHKIQINAFCAMSTHIHMVVTDPDGVLPRFLRSLHHLIAMGAKALRRWRGAVWDNARTSVVRLLTEEAIIEKIAYTLANPVLAGAVQHAHKWSGAKSLVQEIGVGSRQVPRPRFYLSSQNPKWPNDANLQFELPPLIANANEFRRVITERISTEEKKAHKKRLRRSHGMKHRAATISPYKQAMSEETQFAQNSTIAVGPGNIDVYDKAIAASKAFHAAYRNALAHWQAGDRGVSFPKGTWWMREFHAANIASVIACGPNTTVLASHPEH